MTCGKPTEVYSRVCGYHRPVKNWKDNLRAALDKLNSARDAALEFEVKYVVTK